MILLLIFGVPSCYTTEIIILNMSDEVMIFHIKVMRLVLNSSELISLQMILLSATNFLVSISYLFTLILLLQKIGFNIYTIH